jgi:DNA-binding IclR family transcriptional regulator
VIFPSFQDPKFLLTIFRHSVKNREIETHFSFYENGKKSSISNAKIKMSKIISKALNILSAFSVDHPSLRPDELAKISNIPLSTIYRFLDGLLKAGYLIKDSSTQRYRLGPTILRLARVAEAGLDFRTLAIPWMEELFKKTGEAIYLVVRNGEAWLCLESRMPAGVGIRLLLRPGETAPIYAGCPGKVLLAFLGEAEINDLLNKIQLVKITPRTVADRQKLLKQLADIRARGYHYCQGEYVPGAWGLGAPILNAHGTAEGAIVVSGVLQGGKPPINELAKKVLEASQNISAKLGYIPLTQPISVGGKN